MKWPLPKTATFVCLSGYDISWLTNAASSLHTGLYYTVLTLRPSPARETPSSQVLNPLEYFILAFQLPFNTPSAGLSSSAKAPFG